MKNLGKDIERIKQMMSLINEGEFDKTTESEVPLEIRRIVTKIISHFIQKPEIDEFDVNGDSGWFSFNGKDVEKGQYDYSLNYNFDVIYTQRSTFIPGNQEATYGDRYPDEGEKAEYEIEITSLEVMKGNTNLNDEYSYDIIYNGPDFTGIMDIKLSNGDMSSDFIRNEMDETIQDEECESQANNEPDYGRDDEPNYGMGGNPANDYIN